MAFSVYEVIRLACLCVVGLSEVCPRSRGVNKPTMRQASHANDFVNAKSHAREKPLLAGYRKRPFASFKICRFQNKAKCKTEIVKINIIYILRKIKKHFQINSFELSPRSNRG